MQSTGLMREPSATGRFGEFGGRFVPETLVPACQELEAAFREAWADPAFRAELDDVLRDYAGRPSILTECHNLGGRLGVRVLLKREDLNHTGSHKINNVLGQALLAKRMGKTRLVAETGAGQHGVATRHGGGAVRPRVQGLHGRRRRRAPGAQRVPHAAARRRGRGRAQRQPHAEGRRQRGDARLGRHRRRHALLPRLGDGPAPVPVDGARAPPGDRRRGARAVPRADRRRSRRRRGLRRRRLERGRALRRLRRHRGPPRRRRARRRRRHRPRRARRRPRHAQLPDAGRARPGRGGAVDLGRARLPGRRPEHSYLASIGRAEYPPVTDAEVLDAFPLLARTEGIISAFESAHALAWLVREAPALAGPDGAREPLGPRRQGRRPGDGPASAATALGRA